jgi:hypothetical protein
MCTSIFVCECNATHPLKLQCNSLHIAESVCVDTVRFLQLSHEQASCQALTRLVDKLQAAKAELETSLGNTAAQLGIEQAGGAAARELVDELQVAQSSGGERSGNCGAVVNGAGVRCSIEATTGGGACCEVEAEVERQLAYTAVQLSQQQATGAASEQLAGVLQAAMAEMKMTMGDTAAKLCTERASGGLSFHEAGG